MSYPAADPIPDPELSYQELVDYLQHSPNVRAAAQHSLRQGLWAGGTAVGGGLLFGPVGGLIGGIAGSVVGFAQADDYDGIVAQVGQLDGDHQRRLVQSIGGILLAAGATVQQLDTPTAFRKVLTEYATRSSVRDEIWKACVEAVRE